MELAISGRLLSPGSAAHLMTSGCFALAQVVKLDMAEGRLLPTLRRTSEY
jgi:hypothetical protein